MGLRGMAFSLWYHSVQFIKHLVSLLLKAVLQWLKSRKDFFFFFWIYNLSIFWRNKLGTELCKLEVGCELSQPFRISLFDVIGFDVM